MLLHNQKNAAIQWEGPTKVYQWTAYGACEVPDDLVEHIRAQGFPVGATPVPPQEKAALKADAEIEAARADEIAKLRRQLAEAQARTKEAENAAEAADRRATVAREAELAMGVKLGDAEKLAERLTEENADYERMVTDMRVKLASLQDTAPQDDEAQATQKEASKDPAPVADAGKSKPKQGRASQK